MNRILFRTGYVSKATAYLMSWRNPGAEQKLDMRFEDLITSGTAEAMRVIEEMTGEKEVNAIGYCIGGAVLAATQAYYVAKRLKNPVKSATYLATMLDFDNPGSLGAFINELSFKVLKLWIKL